MRSKWFVEQIQNTETLAILQLGIGRFQRLTRREPAIAGARLLLAGLASVDEITIVDLQTADNRPGNVVLHGKDILKLPVVAFRPQVIAVGDVD